MKSVWHSGRLPGLTERTQIMQQAVSGHSINVQGLHLLHRNRRLCGSRRPPHFLRCAIWVVALYTSVHPPTPQSSQIAQRSFSCVWVKQPTPPKPALDGFMGTTTPTRGVARSSRHLRKHWINAVFPASLRFSNAPRNPRKSCRPLSHTVPYRTARRAVRDGPRCII